MDARSASAGRLAHPVANAASQSPSVPQSYVWYVVLVLATVNAFNYMDRIALAVLAPYVKQDLHLSDGQLGLLLGFAFSLFYAICGLPIARLADRSVRRNIIATALAVWSFFTALSGAAQTFLQLFAARVGVGAGEAGCMPPGQSLICDYVPLERRSGFFAVHSFGMMFGMMVGMILTGLLGAAIGWRWTFVVLGVPGLVMALVVFRTVREPQRGHFEAPEAREAVSLGETLRHLFRCPTYLLIGAASILYGFIFSALTQWWPSFYARVHGLSLASVGVQLGFVVGIGSAAGMLVGGWLSNRLAQKDLRYPFRLNAACYAAAMPMAVGSVLAPSTAVSLTFATLAVLAGSLPGGAMVSAVYSVVRPGMRATGGALNVFCTSVIGYGLGPFLVGYLSDVLAPTQGAASLGHALILPACLYPFAAAAMFMVSRFLVSDLRAVGALPAEASLEATEPRQRRALP